MQSVNTHRIITVFLALFAAGMVGFAVIGGFRSFSVVPFWDMWFGGYSFYKDLEMGSIGVWWRQHNEHRIVLSRILFWLDFNWFGGRSVFLIVMNYVLAGASGWLFWRWARLAVQDEKRRMTAVCFGLFLVGWVFQWGQSENFTWSFQSQFFLAQLLPFLALYTLYLSGPGPPVNWWFVVSCCLGALSMGTMGNGILALPLMTLYVVFTRQGTTRIVVISLVTVAVFSLYFDGYGSVAHHSSVTASLFDNTWELVLYSLIYIGGPFARILDIQDPQETVALIAGVFFVVLILLSMPKLTHKTGNFRFRLMLVLCLCHIVGTAIGTGAGRVDFGLTQALASRYVTPALMGWGALFVLIIPVFDEAVARRGGRALWPWMALALLMIPSQLAALESRESQRFERRVAMLALELGVGDWLQIRQVHPNPGEALEIADWASDRDVGVFGIPPFAGLQEQLGGSISQLPTARCHGRVNHVYPVGEKDGIVRVNGWIFDKKKRAVPDLVRFCDEDGSVIGFALTGRERPRIAARLGEEAERSGFTGYIRRDDSSGKVLAVAEDPECAVWMKY